MREAEIRRAHRLAKKQEIDPGRMSQLTSARRAAV